MHTLFLDLASHDGICACVTEHDVLASRAISHRIADHELVPLALGLLREGGWSYGDLTHLACVTGPGGFTSLRVAVTCTNTLVDQLQTPAAGVHLGSLYAARVNGISDFLWLHSTKKHSTSPAGLRGAGELFVRGFGAHAMQFPEPACVALDALRVKLPPGALWVGELLPEHAAELDTAGLQPAPLVETHFILPSFLASQKYTRELLVPWYGRGF